MASNTGSRTPARNVAGIPTSTSAVRASGKVPPQAPAGEELDSGDVEQVVRLSENEVIEGAYYGAKETKSAKPGEVSLLHKILGDDGISYGVWGTVQLNAMLSKVRSGQRVWICYLGKTTLDNSNEMHNWRVVRVAAPGGRKAKEDGTEVPF